MTVIATACRSRTCLSSSRYSIQHGKAAYLLHSSSLGKVRERVDKVLSRRIDSAEPFDLGFAIQLLMAPVISTTDVQI
jgi:hypothetical protein